MKQSTVSFDMWWETQWIATISPSLQNYTYGLTVKHADLQLREKKNLYPL